MLVYDNANYQKLNAFGMMLSLISIDLDLLLFYFYKFLDGLGSSSPIKTLLAKEFNAF